MPALHMTAADPQPRSGGRTALSRPDRKRRRRQVPGRGRVPAAAEASAAGVPVDVHVIGTYDGLVDPYGGWSLRREVETSGCVLVRPDQHVARRAQRFGADRPAELTAAVRQAVGWPAPSAASRVRPAGCGAARLDSKWRCCVSGSDAATGSDRKTLRVFLRLA
jgi:hypothetical protein